MPKGCLNEEPRYMPAEFVERGPSENGRHTILYSMGASFFASVCIAFTGNVIASITQNAVNATGEKGGTTAVPLATSASPLTRSDNLEPSSGFNFDPMFFVATMCFLVLSAHKLFMAHNEKWACNPGEILFPCLRTAGHFLVDTGIAFMTSVLYSMNKEGVPEYVNMLLLSMAVSKFFSSSSYLAVHPHALPVAGFSYCDYLSQKTPASFDEKKEELVREMWVIISGSKHLLQEGWCDDSMRLMDDCMRSFHPLGRKEKFSQLISFLEKKVVFKDNADLGNIQEQFVALRGQMEEVLLLAERFRHQKDLRSTLPAAWVSPELWNPAPFRDTSLVSQAYPSLPSLPALSSQQVVLIAFFTFIPAMAVILMYSNFCLGGMLAETDHTDGWMAMSMSVPGHVWHSMPLVRKETRTPRVFFSMLPRFGVTACLVVLACMANSDTLGLCLAALVNMVLFVEPPYDLVMPAHTEPSEEPVARPTTVLTGMTFEGRPVEVEMTPFSRDEEQGGIEVIVEEEDELAVDEDVGSDYRAFEEKEEELPVSKQQPDSRGFVDISLDGQQQQLGSGDDLNQLFLQRKMFSTMRAARLRAAKKPRESIIAPEETGGDYHALGAGVSI